MPIPRLEASHCPSTEDMQCQTPTPMRTYITVCKHGRSLSGTIPRLGKISKLILLSHLRMVDFALPCGGYRSCEFQVAADKTPFAQRVRGPKHNVLSIMSVLRLKPNGIKRLSVFQNHPVLGE